MFWRKKAGSSEPGVKGMPGSKFVPDLVGGHLVTEYKQNPDWVWKLKSVSRKREESKTTWDIRIFDEVEVATKNVRIRNYNSFDEHPELILFEGWYDNDLRQIELEDKRKT